MQNSRNVFVAGECFSSENCVQLITVVGYLTPEIISKLPYIDIFNGWGNNETRR